MRRTLFSLELEFFFDQEVVASVLIKHDYFYKALVYMK
jgi:hypothetical protein